MIIIRKKKQKRRDYLRFHMNAGDTFYQVPQVNNNKTFSTTTPQVANLRFDIGRTGFPARTTLTGISKLFPKNNACGFMPCYRMPNSYILVTKTQPQ